MVRIDSARGFKARAPVSASKKDVSALYACRIRAGGAARNTSLVGTGEPRWEEILRVKTPPSGAGTLTIRVGGVAHTKKKRAALRRTVPTVVGQLSLKVADLAPVRG